MKAGTLVARVRYEMRILGVGIFAAPLLVIALFVGVAALASFESGRQGASSAVGHHDMAIGLLFLLEAGLPLVAGLVAAYLIATNPAKELHFTLVTSYRATMGQRLALFTCWAFLASLGACIAIARAGYWIVPQDAPRNLLIFSAPLLWFIATGALLSLLLGNWIASNTILGLLWIGELFLRPWMLQHAITQKLYLFLTIFAPDAAYWQTNRLTLLGVAMVFLVLVALLLRRNEAILGHEA